MNKEKIRILAKVMLVAGSMTIGAKIPYSLMDVPGTFQTFFLCLTALLFTRWEVLSGQALYLILGIFFPVFSHEIYHGQAVFMGYSAGYIYGFLPAAFLVSWMVKGEKADLFTLISMAVMAHFTVLLFGITWLHFHENMEWNKALFQGGIIFLPGAFMKSALAGVLVFLMHRYVLKNKKLTA
ncbi:MAG: biotin transporter BioY [Bacteroidetes bacterium]|nr:MAG: biotin transporter BioY [Bacteroidota bacterium]